MSDGGVDTIGTEEGGLTLLLQVKVVVVLVLLRGLLRGVVDGDEGGGAADDLGGGQ